MTKQHPIKVPSELLEQWRKEAPFCGPREEWIATKAAQWGADQELDACVDWLLRETPIDQLPKSCIDALRAARRPKPPSLKEQALEALRSMRIDPVIPGKEVSDKYDIIRRALESLPEQ